MRHHGPEHRRGRPVAFAAHRPDQYGRYGHVPRAQRRRPQWPRPLVALLLLAFLGAAILGLGAALDRAGFFSSTDWGRQSAADTSVEGAPADGASAQAVTTQPPPNPVAANLPPQVADPVRVRVPAIGVDAGTDPMGIRSDGSIEVPEDFAQTGWWKDGPEPGEIGPSVILGHVDSVDGPAVFFDLRGLTAGDEIHVDRADGTTVTFLVERIEQHSKDDFPTEAVYGPTTDSQLRLVTCGGVFDQDARSYKDNLIVFASQKV